MPAIEKGKKPAVLLLDPLTDRAAAYTNNHRLIAPLASAKLVAFAKANAHQQTLWDESMNGNPRRPREVPDWATAEVRSRCVLLWIARGGASDEYFASIPKK